MVRVETQITINTGGIRKILDELRPFAGGAGGAGGQAQIIEMMFEQWAAKYERFVRRRFSAASRGDGTWAPLKLSTILGRKYKGRKLTRALKARIGAQEKPIKSLYNKTFRRKKKEFMARFGGGAPAKGLAKSKWSAKQKRAESLARAHATAAVRRFGGTVATRRMTALVGIGETAILLDTGTLFAALNLNMPGNIKRRIEGGLEVGIGGPAMHPGGGASIADIAVFHHTGDTAHNLPARPIIVPPDAETIEQMSGDARRAIHKITDAANAMVKGGGNG